MNPASATTAPAKAAELATTLRFDEEKRLNALRNGAIASSTREEILAAVTNYALSVISAAPGARSMLAIVPNQHAAAESVLAWFVLLQRRLMADRCHQLIAKWGG